MINFPKLFDHTVRQSADSQYGTYTQNIKNIILLQITQHVIQSSVSCH